MGADICQKHLMVDDAENPCLMCVIEGIREWSVSKDGSPEQAEKSLREIQSMCERVLNPEEPSLELPTGMQRYHVVLKRVYNVIVDDVVAKDEQDAIKTAELRCDVLSKQLSNICVSDDTYEVVLDDGDEPVAALVDTYHDDQEAGYKEESYFEFDADHDRYNKKE